MHLQENSILDQGHTNFAQYPLHHVIYSATKFEVATSKGLGGDTFARKVTNGRTDAWTDRQTLV